MPGVLPTALQQWVDARTQLSKAIQTYVSAATFLESTCTPFAIRSHPKLMTIIENNLESLGHEELAFHRAQAMLKKKKNSYISPINVLPSELLGYIFEIAVTPAYPYDSPNGYEEKKLSQVCSRWRQIALEVCPVWSQVSLTFGDLDFSANKLEKAMVELRDLRGRRVDVPMHRQPDMDDASYIQATLSTVAPYIKRLGDLDLAAADVGQLQLFLEFLLEKGAPGSLTRLKLSINGAPLILPETNTQSSDRLCQFLRHVADLTLCSVALDWPSVTLDRLSSMWLADIPSFCCPTLAQLTRLLSSCPGLQALYLKRITIPTPDSVVPEPAKLEHLEILCLEEVDVQRLLPIISPGRCELDLQLLGAIDGADTLATLFSFAGRANIHELIITLSKTRSNEALARLLYFAMSSLPGLDGVLLAGMTLRDSELSTLASHSLAEGGPRLFPSSTDGLHEIERLEFMCCTIQTTAESVYNAVSALPWIRLPLTKCDYCPTIEGEADGVPKALEPITTTSEFGVRLYELSLGRAELYSW